MKKLLCLFLTLSFLLAQPMVVNGWGDRGHEISGLAAALKMPADTPQFFLQAYPQLSYLNPEPDRWRERAESDLDPAVKSYSFDHYIDLELIPSGGLNLPDRYAFADAMAKAGKKSNDAGFLPYQILEGFQKLRMEFRLWRQATDPIKRAMIEQQIITVAGIMGHYVADGANPHHTTIHHNGWIGDNPKGYSTDKQLHYRFESVYVSSHININDVLPLVGAATVLEHPREDVISYLQKSRSLLETLYDLEKKESFSENTKSQEHKDFVAGRLAAGSQMLRDLWWTAWVTSEVKPKN